MGGPKKSRKRLGSPSLASIIEKTQAYREVRQIANSVLSAMVRRYTGPELEAVLIQLLSAVAQKLHEVQEADHEP